MGLKDVVDSIASLCDTLTRVHVVSEHVVSAGHGEDDTTPAWPWVHRA